MAERIPIAELVEYGMNPRIVGLLEEWGAIYLDEVYLKYDELMAFHEIGKRCMESLALAIGKRILGAPKLDLYAGHDERRAKILRQRLSDNAEIDDD